MVEHLPSMGKNPVCDFFFFFSVTHTHTPLPLGKDMTMPNALLTVDLILP